MGVEAKVEEALALAGNKHRYQKLIIIFLSLTWVINSFLVLGPSFYYMDPIWDCGPDEREVAEDVACSKLSECRLVNDYTIVARLELYCDRQAERSMIQSALPIGSFAGLILMNYLSDRKGRRLAVIMDLFIGLLGCLCMLLMIS